MRKEQKKENLKRSIQLDQKMELCYPQKIFKIEEFRKEVRASLKKELKRRNK